MHSMPTTRLRAEPEQATAVTSATDLGAPASRHVGGVEPRARPLLGGEVRAPQLRHLAVEPLAQPRHAGPAHRLEAQVGGDGLDLPGRDARRPHVAHGRGEGRVRPRPARDHVLGEVRPLPELGDPERHPPDAGVERALAAAVARHPELGRLLVHGRVQQPLQQGPQRGVDVDRAVGADAGGGERLLVYSVHSGRSFLQNRLLW